MRISYVVVMLGLTLAACAGRGFRSSETIQDIMVNQVAPAAGALWGSVGLESTVSGTVERAPRSEAEWEALRRNVEPLLEAADRLRIPKRRVAAPGAVLADASFPGNLTAPEVQTVIDADPLGFKQRAEGLREAGRIALSAIRARDVQRLGEAGETVNAACAACHSAYWYPYSIQPVQ